MAIIISNFELLFKNQAPAVGIEVETVLQGYFLQLTNLVQKDLLFDVEFISIPPSSNKASRKIDNNTFAILDNPGASSDDNVFDQLTLVPGTQDVYRASRLNLRIASKGTALLAIIPQISAIPGDSIAVTRDFEVRGYVQISVPVVNGAAQNPGAADVLVSPQSRGAFFQFPNATNFGGGEIRNQLQNSMQTSSGGCLFSIEPDQPLVA